METKKPLVVITFGLLLLLFLLFIILFFTASTASTAPIASIVSSSQTLNNSIEEPVEIISKDPEYLVYKKNNRTFYQVKMVAHYFYTFIANKRFVFPGFFHTLVAVADPNNYVVGKNGTGSRGWDLTNTEEYGYHLRTEIDRKAKSYLHRHLFAPSLRIQHVCYTINGTFAELEEWTRKFRGKYDLFSRNCVDFSEYLLEKLCGTKLARRVSEKFRPLLFKVLSGVSRFRDYKDPSRLNFTYKFVSYPRLVPTKTQFLMQQN